MAKDTRFKKGQSGNPTGRPKDPPEIREARKLSNQEYIRIVTKYLFMTRDQINIALRQKNANMLELMVGGIVVKATEKGDDKLATFLLDRLIGKVPSNVNLAADESFHSQLITAIQKAQQESE